MVGPRRITKKARNAALSAFKKLLTEPWNCGNCSALIEPDDQSEGQCYECGAALPDLKSAAEDPAEFIDALIADWPPTFRDCANRDYAGKVIVFAGDRSWGDRPDGAGYLYLERLLASGVSKELGIE